MTYKVVLGEHPQSLLVRLTKGDSAVLVATATDDDGNPTSWPTPPALEFARVSNGLISTHTAEVSGSAAVWTLTHADVSEIWEGAHPGPTRVRVTILDPSDEVDGRVVIMAGKVSWSDGWTPADRAQRVTYTVQRGGGPQGDPGPEGPQGPEGPPGPPGPDGPAYIPVGHWEPLNLTQPVAYVDGDSGTVVSELPPGASAQTVTDNGDGTLTFGPQTVWTTLWPLPEWATMVAVLGGDGSIWATPFNSAAVVLADEGTWPGRVVAAKDAIAEGDKSHAEGERSHAEGAYSHAEGFGSHAEGTGSHAEGHGSHAEGNGSHAEGYGSHAEGNGSHAEGYDSHAEGNGSHAEGFDSYAEGYGSHAEGLNSHAEGYGSHAEGRSRWGRGTGQTVRQPLTAETYNPTPTTLIDGLGNPARIGAGHAAAFTVTTTCRSTDGAVAAAWKIDGFMVTAANGDPTVTTQPAVLLGTHGDTTGLTVTVTAGGPGTRAITVTVTGRTGVSIHWYATAEWQEVG